MVKKVVILACVATLLVTSPAWAADETLLDAVRDGDEPALAELLRRGADVNSTDDQGRTLLMVAAEEGWDDLVEMLVAGQADALRTGPGGWNALMYAAQSGIVGSLDSIYRRAKGQDQAGAFIGKRNEDGSTALFIAVDFGHAEAVHFLLDHGFPINTTGRFGRTPLSCAAVEGHAAVTDLLLQRGASTAARDAEGRTALLLAVAAGRTGTIEQLLRAGADIEARDAQGMTALMLAARNSDTAALRLLLDAGAQLQAVDRLNRSALSHAAQEGRQQAIALLVNRGGGQREGGQSLAPADWEERVVRGRGVVVVHFWTENLPSYRLFPVIDQLAGRLEGRAAFFKISDRNRDLMRRYAIEGAPTIMVFRDGEPKVKLLGAGLTLQQLEAQLRRWL